MQRGPQSRRLHEAYNRLTSVKLQATLCTVKIRNIVHKGLKRLYAEDNTKGVPPDTVDKLRKMLAFLDDMEAPEELRALPSWKVHTLTGDRKGTCSLSVTRTGVSVSGAIELRKTQNQDADSLLVWRKATWLFAINHERTVGPA